MQTLQTMIVEDEPEVRNLLRSHLEEMGYCVVAEAADGLQAVEAARIYHPDAIIMDIQMPNMNGIEAARSILKESPCAILFLSGFGEEALVKEAGETGAQAYLMKPFRGRELAPALEIAVRRFREGKARGQEIDKLRDTLECRKLIERAKGILMDRHRLTESEAHKRIHFQARNNNMTMREVAQSIINVTNLL